VFWDKLIELCAKKGVAVGQCVRDIGLTPGSATGWKKGAVPSEVNLRKLADYFEVPVEDLAEESGLSTSETVIPERLLSLIESQQSTIDKQSDTILTQSSSVATQSSALDKQSGAIVTLSDSIATQSHAIDTHSNTIATLSRVIEVMAADGRRGGD
jgi:transcriptional regulator with XRE-family HTH domain